MGLDAVELDVRRCATGELVVRHDPCPVPRADLPADVPLLTEALDACAPMWVNVEIKNDPSEPDFDPDETVARDVAALLTARPEPIDRWIVSSFRRETTDALHRLAPALGGDEALTELGDLRRSRLFRGLQRTDLRRRLRELLPQRGEVLARLPTGVARGLQIRSELCQTRIELRHHGLAPPQFLLL